MRLRLTFSKNEPMRYTGHLDLHRALERTLRRAELPLAYSQGYNPRGRLNLASALPLGVTSEGELAEVWLSEPRPLEEILALLQEHAPPGLTVSAVEEVPDPSPKLPNLLISAEYQATFHDPPADLAERLQALLASDHIARTHKGKTYDLRPLIESLDWHPAPDQRSGHLHMRLAARPGATGRADEVLDALGLAEAGSRLVRTALLLDDQGGG